ncbi:MAG: DegT/DnrJ/EryC1/StrS family aminotransferase [Gammaproteobacteria bacterium]
MLEKKLFLPVAEPDIGLLEEQYLLEAFRSGWISSLGDYIERFETGFAEFCGTSCATAVCNGTAALHLALLAGGIKAGDEVIVPALTFAATAAAVRHCGATPVFVESEPDIGTLDPKSVESAISPKTKAIIAVHLYGHPADMDNILQIARKHSLLVIEDAAEAHGAKYRGRPIGSLGQIGIFSFYGNKIVTTGEGGMVVTNQPEFHERVRFYKDHAMDPKRRYWHPEVGFNYRMTNLQAAIGCAQLKRFDELLSWRKQIIAYYRDEFRDIEEITFNPSKDWADPVPWMVCCLLPDGTEQGKRDQLMEWLKQAGVDSRPYFHLLCDMPPYASCKRIDASGKDLPVARKLSARGINLPILRRLTREDVGRIKIKVEHWLKLQ